MVSSSLEASLSSKDSNVPEGNSSATSIAISQGNSKKEINDKACRLSTRKDLL
jgi:hypothetical protein